MRHVRNFLYFVMGLLLSALFLAPYARAQFNGVYNGIPTQVAGPYSPWPGAMNSSAYPTNAQVTEVLDANGVTIARAGSVRVATSAGEVAVNTTARATATRAGVAKAAAKAGVRAIPGIGTVVTIAELVNELRDQGYQTDSGGSLVVPEPPGIPTDAPGTGYFYNASPSLAAKTPQAACEKLGMAHPHYLDGYQMSAVVDSSYRCTVSFLFGISWQAVYINSGIGKLSNWYTPALTNSLSAESVEQAILNKMNGDNSVTKRVYDALKQDAINHTNNGGQWPTDYTPLQPNSPASLEQTPSQTPEKTKSTSTTQKPDGSTETTRTTESVRITPQPSGSTLGDLRSSYVMQTIINNYTTNSVTNQTTTNTTVNENGTIGEGQKQDDDDVSFSDSSMPDVPSLYTQKYPDGIAGVWRDSAPDISRTQFWQGIRSMFPTFGGGQCPSWAMSFSIGSMGNFGTIPFDVPCWIFQAVGLMVLTTAAFTARKIIF